MAQIDIDFYLLQQTGRQDDWVCRLAEKAYQNTRQLYIHTGSGAQAQRLDHKLWTFKDNSFIPHQLVHTGQTEYAAPILIGYHGIDSCHQDILINLTEAVPDGHQQFQRIIEIVDPDGKQAARARYRFYREQAYTLKTHTV